MHHLILNSNTVRAAGLAALLTVTLGPGSGSGLRRLQLQGNGVKGQELPDCLEVQQVGAQQGRGRITIITDFVVFS